MTKNANPIHTYTRRPDAEEILGGDFFQRLGDKALGYMKDPRKAAHVIGNTLQKSIDPGRDGFFADIKEDVQTMGRMLNAILKGEYKRFPAKALVRILAGVIYFLFLEDILRDYIPLLGLLDDAIVVAWVVRGIHEELDNFLAWEVGKRLT